MHRHRDDEQQPAPGLRLRGAAGTVLKASAGAGLAVLGAYLLSRTRQQRDLAARIEKLEAMLEAIEGTGGGAPTA